MYNDYESFVNNITKDNIKTINFKSNRNYNSILEHVSVELGEQYLRLIEKEFNNITFENILEYVNINDVHGCPTQYTYKNKDGNNFTCSPTSLRYVYNALVILDHYKTKESNSIVEVGCGYGGLFLAICYFSKLLNIKIEHYHFVDLEPICNLISLYLDVNNNHVSINYSIHLANNYGMDINADNLFFISNYCFTEIDTIYRTQYILNLIPKCSSGFIIWQTCFNYGIDNSYEIVDVKNIEEEKPQTSPHNEKNYFVYF
jgi:hypothetical protein